MVSWPRSDQLLGKVPDWAWCRSLRLSAEYGRTPSQVVLRWHIQRGIIVFPKASSPERLRENADIFDFELSADDMRAIDGVDSGNRVGSNPETFNRR